MPIDATNNTFNDSQTAVNPTLLTVFIVYWVFVFTTGIIGNVFVIGAVYRFRHMKKPVNVFLANLALSDLLFALLSVLDGWTFVKDGNWVFGDVVCRLQSTLIEVSYTTSVLTLVAVSIERYFSICHPHKTKRTYGQSLVISALLWLAAFAFCAVLFSDYETRELGDGTTKCKNTSWPPALRLAFYTVHSLTVYILPITVMCLSHYLLSRAIKNPTKVQLQGRTANKRVCGTLKRRQKTIKRRLKVVRLLVTVTGLFFLLWTPFITLRLLKYNGVFVLDILWHGSQLLILSTTAVNCFLYAAMSDPFRMAFKMMLRCRVSVSDRNSVVENSHSKN